jgi:Flp pilus assembly protein TadD
MKPQPSPKFPAPKPQRPVPPASPPPPSPPVRVPPLFRRVDWLALLICFAVVETIYFLTLAPQVTLEDSGELLTGSFYAGIPHPPGYPFWAIYSWLWTRLVPFGNVAWRVELGQAAAMGMGCSLIAFMVSRGSSMLMEGIEELKGLVGKWENAICLVCGVTAGLLMALDNSMWYESVAINRASEFGVPWMIMVLLCLLRWIYAPHQRRYLYCAMFFFGICATIHQTLIVAAMGIEIGIACTQPKLGRDLVFFNGLAWVVLRAAATSGVWTSFAQVNPTVMSMFNTVGIGSVIACLGLAIKLRFASLWTGKETVSKKDAVLAWCGVGLLVASILTFWFVAKDQGGSSFAGAFWITAGLALVTGSGIAWMQPRFGLDLFFYSSLLWLAGRTAAISGVWTGFAQVSPTVMNIFNAVDVCAFLACAGLAIKLRSSPPRTKKDAVLSWCGAGLLALLIFTFWFVARYHGGPSFAATFWATAGLVLVIWALRLLSEWPACLVMGLLWTAGASFYFYEAIAGMTNPPMEWGYPRTVAGFFHALTRGQYDKINPTNIIADPKMFLVQLWLLAKGVAAAFNWVYMFFALLPFLFFLKMKRRERNWLITVAAIYPFLGVLLTIFLNPQKDRQSVELLRVFFAASHTVVAILIGYGLALTAAYMATNYQRFRLWGWMGGGMALVLACYCLFEAAGELYIGQGAEVPLGDLPHWVAQAFAPGQYGLPIYANLILLALPVIFLVVLALYRTRAPLLVTLALFAVMPVCSGLSHWFHSEQRGHWFGYWYGHDMFTPPFAGPDGKLTYDPALRAQAMKGTNANLVYPEMARDAVVYGGTDPGRFCPTYMIFCESFIPHSCQPEQDTNFDRRDCYLITQNALADPTYLDYIRAQYNRSAQQDPPFFQEFLPTELPQVFHGPTQSLAWLDNYFETLGATIERQRRTGTSWFKEDHFKDVSKLAARLRPHEGQDELSKYLYTRLSQETQALVTAGADSQPLRRALAQDFNRLLEWPSLYSPERFKDIPLPPLIQKAAQTEQLTNTTVRLNRRMLEEAYPQAIAKTLGGVYPDTEIRTASTNDLRACEEAYEKDAVQRFTHDREHPTEPRQIKPGEDINVDDQGRLSFGGVLVVMGINSYVTKVMFDANPDHEFYVEESYPMDWMFPYLTPFGIIMQVNRQPLELSDQTIARDHLFWSQYSDRLVGNWITYDTTPKELCDFAERIYLRHDYTGFKGDPKFIRDDDAQKGFSKLRSAIGASIYQWRADHSRNETQRARLLKEAEFAFKQAFVYCPYSEGAYKYAELLLETRRPEEAVLVARTFQKLDPYNRQMQNMVVQLYLQTGQQHEALLAARDFLKLEPNNPGLQDLVNQLDKNQPGPSAVPIQDIYNDIATALKANQTNQAAAMLDQLLHSKQANGPILSQVADFYAKMGNIAKAEEAMRRATQVEPNASQSWYNLAIVQAFQGRAADAAESVKKAFEANARERAADPRMIDLRENARTNPYFNNIRLTAEFRAAMGTN